MKAEHGHHHGRHFNIQYTISLLLLVANELNGAQYLRNYAR